MLINKSTQNDNNQSLKRMEKDSLPRRRKASLPHERLGKRPTYADYAKRGWEGEREEESRKRGRGGRWRILVVRATLKKKDHRILRWYLDEIHLDFTFECIGNYMLVIFRQPTNLRSYLAPKYMRLEILFGTITAAPNYCLYVSVRT